MNSGKRILRSPKNFSFPEKIMASIYRRGPCQWQVLIRRKGYPTQAKVFETKAEAEAWSKTIESEMVRGVFASRKEAENTTLSEALDRYEREVIPTKKGALQESMRIRIWKRTPLAKRFLASIQGKDIAGYRDMRLKEVAPNTVRHELAFLSHVFTMAVKEWGMMGLINPVRQIRIPKAPPGRDRRLKIGELERIVEASKSEVLPSIVRLAVETGMRQEEIAGMVWNRVDLMKRTVTLPETKNGEKRIVPSLLRPAGYSPTSPAGSTGKSGTCSLPKQSPSPGGGHSPVLGKPTKKSVKKRDRNRIPLTCSI